MNACLNRSSVPQSELRYRLNYQQKDLNVILPNELADLLDMELLKL